MTKTETAPLSYCKYTVSFLSRRHRTIHVLLISVSRIKGKYTKRRKFEHIVPRRLKLETAWKIRQRLLPFTDLPFFPRPGREIYFSPAKLPRFSRKRSAIKIRVRPVSIPLAGCRLDQRKTTWDPFSLPLSIAFLSRNSLKLVRLKRHVSETQPEFPRSSAQQDSTNGWARSFNP